MEQVARAPEAERRRFSRRLVVLETPEIAEKLERMAADAGHSLGAEVRGANRHWIRAWEGQDDA